MKTFSSILPLLFILLLSPACVPESNDGSTTEEFRTGLVSADDLRMNYEGGNSTAMMQNGEAGDPSILAYSTANAVVGTNVFLVKLLVTMRFIVNLPPTIAEEDHHMWEGTNEGLFLRVTIDRSEVAEGIRYDYIMEGRRTDEEDELLTIFKGHSVRLADDPLAEHDGFGQVRHDFDNLNALQPERNIGGNSTVAFRRAGGVHQVEVRFADIISAENPNFPPTAAYHYVHVRDHSGTLTWLGKDDFTQDGEALEDIAAQSQWNADGSGVALAHISGGNLEVDYLNATECWDTGWQKTFAQLDSPDGELHEGELQSCGPVAPDELQLPDETTLGGDAPAIPTAHPEES